MSPSELGLIIRIRRRRPPPIANPAAFALVMAKLYPLRRGRSAHGPGLPSELLNVAHSLRSTPPVPRAQNQATRGPIETKIPPRQPRPGSGPARCPPVIGRRALLTPQKILLNSACAAAMLAQRLESCSSAVREHADRRPPDAEGVSSQLARWELSGQGNHGTPQLYSQGTRPAIWAR